MSKERTNFSGGRGLLAVSSSDGWCLFRLPGWTPPGVGREIGIIAATPMAHEAAAILINLAWDVRMMAVWTELTRLRRGTSEYLHPARPPPHAPQRTPYEAQQSSLAETLHFTFRSASDGRHVTTIKESSAMKTELLRQAAMLRGLAAQTPSDANVADMLAAGGLLRTAAQLEEQAAIIRGPEDPLTIVRHTTDPRSRGIQIDISSFFLDRFGDRLDATAGTLAAVSLGLSKRSLSVSRSAIRQSRK